MMISTRLTNIQRRPPTDLMRLHARRIEALQKNERLRDLWARANELVYTHGRPPLLLKEEVTLLEDCVISRTSLHQGQVGAVVGVGMGLGSVNTVRIRLEMPPRCLQQARGVSAGWRGGVVKPVSATSWSGARCGHFELKICWGWSRVWTGHSLCVGEQVWGMVSGDQEHLVRWGERV